MKNSVNNMESKKPTNSRGTPAREPSKAVIPLKSRSTATSVNHQNPKRAGTSIPIGTSQRDSQSTQANATASLIETRPLQALVSAQDEARMESMIQASRSLLHKELVETRALRETVRRLSARADANIKARELVSMVVPSKAKESPARPTAVPQPALLETPPRAPTRVAAHAIGERSNLAPTRIRRAPSPSVMSASASSASSSALLMRRTSASPNHLSSTERPRSASSTSAQSLSRRRSSLTLMGRPPLASLLVMGGSTPLRSAKSISSAEAPSQEMRSIEQYKHVRDESETEHFRRQLVEFYSVHNPKKVKDVDRFVQSCVDSQAQARLKFRLLRKYGHVTDSALELAWKFAVSPVVSSSVCYFCFCARLMQINEITPSSTEGVFVDKEQVIPVAQQNHQNERFVSDLIRFYERFKPAKLASGDQSVSKLVMESKSWDTVDISVCKLKLLLKYNLFPALDSVLELIVRPTAPSTRQGKSDATGPACCSALSDLVKAVTTFYSRANPSKSPSDVDTMVTNHFGEARSSELKFKLLCKYGFVPCDENSGKIAIAMMMSLSGSNQPYEWRYESPVKARANTRRPLVAIHHHPA